MPRKIESGLFSNPLTTPDGGVLLQQGSSEGAGQLADLSKNKFVKFLKDFGAPAKPFRKAPSGLIIKASLGLTDEELMEHIKKNPYLQIFIGLEDHQYSAPFIASIMVYFRKRLPESVVNDCNKGIVNHDLNVIQAAKAVDDKEQRDGSGSAIQNKNQPGIPKTMPTRVHY